MYKMMIVDDEYLVRMGIKETIPWEDYGVTVVAEATNGKEGLELAKKYQPDIIISDIKMPFMDGLEFVQQLNNLQIDCEIIILSGYKDFEYAKHTLENGAYSYLLKPIDNDELVSTVQKSIISLQEKREKENYYNQLEEELPIIRKKVLNNILIGSYMENAQISEKVKFYNINVRNQGYVIFGRLDYPENLEGEEKIEKVIQGLLGFVIEQISAGRITDLSSITYDSYFVILVDNSINRHKLKEYCTTALEDYERQYGSIVSIGISSSYRQYKDIKIAYQEAQKSAKLKLFPMINSVSTAKSLLSEYHPQVIAAMNYIAQNYSNKNLTIKMIADHVYVSESFLMHVFKDNVGKTVNECLTEYRMIIAKKKLMSGQFKIYEIADQIGYGDSKYFSQLFKKREGISPSDFAKKDY